ncbi:MAG TPA: GNAT family protein [Burkholderiales bacterium]|nr:GNAT family protein [Burkholderiales bacterium]
MRLDAVRTEDLELLYEWINDRETVVFNSPYSPVHFRNHLDWFEQVRRRDDLVLFAIRADGRLVGTCQLHDIHVLHRSAELQIRIGSRIDRGKRYGTAAVSQLVRFGFRDRNLNRIGLHVLADNAAAIRLYVRAGFREEGRLREAAFIDGAFKDLILFSVLRSEFEGR